MTKKDVYTEWDMALAEFRGATISSLENIRDELKSLNDAVSDINKNLVSLKIKVAVISATVGFIVSLITQFV